MKIKIKLLSISIICINLLFSCNVVEEKTYKNIDTNNLILAGYNISEDIIAEVIDFNQNNSNGYYIETKDYADYDLENPELEEGINKLNIDLATGNIPDILISDFYNISFFSYKDKNIFFDLNDFLDKDLEIKKDDYMENVINSLSVDNELMAITPSFSIHTMIGKSELFKDLELFNIESVMNLAKDKGYSVFDVDIDFLLAYMSYISSSKFIDYNNKKCFFDNDEFKNLLEFIKINANDCKEDYLLSQYRLSSFLDFHEISRFEEKDILGFPSYKDDSISLLDVNFAISICKQSKNKDIAWEFTRRFLLDEYQDNLLFDSPVKKSALKQMEEIAVKGSVVEDEYGKKVYNPNIIIINNKKVDIGYASEAEITKVWNAIQEPYPIFTRVNKVNNIIYEEINNYINGNSNEEKTSQTLQNRINIVINE